MSKENYLISESSIIKRVPAQHGRILNIPTVSDSKSNLRKSTSQNIKVICNLLEDSYKIIPREIVK